MAIFVVMGGNMASFSFGFKGDSLSVLVDDDDHKKICEMMKNGYAISYTCKLPSMGNRYVYAMVHRYVDGVKESEYLHRVILGLTKGCGIVDHINRDRLDCRKSNLRIVSDSLNKINTGIRAGKKTSKYRGVFFDNARKKWTATFSFSGDKKRKRFDTEGEAKEQAEKWLQEIVGS